MFGEYRVNFVIDIIVRFLEFASFFFAWEIILGKSINFPGWDIKGLVLLYSFQQFFIFLLSSFNGGDDTLREKILNGSLDQYLARPNTPWFTIIVTHMHLSLGGLFLGIAGLLLAIALGVKIGLLTFLMGIAFLILAALICQFFGLALACLAFWMGRVDFIGNIWDALFEFDTYPSNIFPGAIQTLLAFTLPFIFAHTIPAQLILEQLTIGDGVKFLAAATLILIINFGIFHLIWNAGLKKYEAFG
jgi:ABC-type uncharacterized transport system permease subunit